MKNDFLQFRLTSFEGELDEYLEHCSRSFYDITEYIANDKIARLEREYKELSKNFDDIYEFEGLYLDDFQEQVVCEKMKQYDILCGYMQSLYAGFENQVATYSADVKKNPELRLNPKIDFTKYPCVNQTKNAVNVMKHGFGRSYNELEAENSKFLEKPVIFKGYPVYSRSSVILNIEYEDLEKFVKSAKQVWRDILSEHTANKLANETSITNKNTTTQKAKNKESSTKQIDKTKDTKTK